jgi:hypothetical protein
MKSLMGKMALTVMLAMPAGAFAEEVDFLARMNNLNLQTPAPTTRLVGVAIFNDAVFDGEAGDKRIFFNISHVDGETSTVLFQGEGSINPTQTQVITGNQNIGRIELTYDPILNRVEARVSMNVQTFQFYRVSILSGSYAGSALVHSTIAL